jgi:hypothetical protein
MPSVLIEVRRSYMPEQETAIIEAVHGALRQVFNCCTIATSAWSFASHR